MKFYALNLSALRLDHLAHTDEMLGEILKKTAMPFGSDEPDRTEETACRKNNQKTEADERRHLQTACREVVKS